MFTSGVRAAVVCAMSVRRDLTVGYVITDLIGLKAKSKGGLMLSFEGKE
jgi:hypothetical protein